MRVSRGCASVLRSLWSAFDLGGRAWAGSAKPAWEFADDRAEEACGEQPGPEGTRRVLADGPQLSQCCTDGGGHVAKLPSDLLADRLRLVGVASPAALAVYAAAPRACAPI